MEPPFIPDTSVNKSAWVPAPKTPSPPGSVRGTLGSHTVTANWAQQNREGLNQLAQTIFAPSTPASEPAPISHQINREPIVRPDIPNPVKGPFFTSLGPEQFSVYQDKIANALADFGKSNLQGPEIEFAQQLLQTFLESHNARDFYNMAQQLKPKDLEQQAFEKILNHFNTKKESVKLLKQEYLNFQDAYKKAEETALKLNKQFQFLFPDQKVTVDNKTNVTTLTYPQFQLALKLAQDSFPNLLDDLWNDRITSHVTRLIQIIVAGDNAKSAPLPTSPLIFAFKETEGLTTTKERPVVQGTNFAYHHFRNILREDKPVGPLERTKTQDFKKLMQEAAAKYVNDCIIRPGNTLEINEIEIPLGIKAGSVTSPFDAIKGSYLIFLQEAPLETIKEAVKNIKDSPLVRETKIVYGNRGSDKNWFHTDTLRNIFSDQRARHRENEKVVAEIDRMIKASMIDPVFLKEIGKKLDAELSLSDLEDLLRYHFLQYTIVANQSNQAAQTVNFHLELIELNNNLNPYLPNDRSFIISGDPTGPFISRGRIEAKITREPLNEAGIKERFNDATSVFNSEMSLHVHSMTAVEHPVQPTLTSLNELRFNWKAPQSIIEAAFKKLKVEIPQAVSTPLDVKTLTPQLLTLATAMEGDTLSVDPTGNIAVNAAPARRTFMQSIASIGQRPPATQEALSAALENVAQRMETMIRELIFKNIASTGDRNELIFQFSDIYKLIGNAQGGLVRAGAPQASIDRFSEIIRQLSNF